MTILIVIPSALENSAASLGADRMSGHRTIRVNPSMIEVLIDASKAPSVVLDNADHLSRDS